MRASCSLSAGASGVVAGPDRLGLGLIALVMVVGGGLHLAGALLGHRRGFKTTIGRQLQSAFGPRGAIAFLIVLGVALLVGGIWLGGWLLFGGA